MQPWSSRRVVVTVSFITATAILLPAGYGFVAAQPAPTALAQSNAAEGLPPGLMPAPTPIPPPYHATSTPVPIPLQTPDPAIAPTPLPPVEDISRKEGPRTRSTNA